MGIKIFSYKNVRKEASNTRIIQKVFKQIPMSSQFSIGSYSIDLYFLENKLTIKFKKHDHMEKDINYKANQQKFIEDQLIYK